MNYLTTLNAKAAMSAKKMGRSMRGIYFTVRGVVYVPRTRYRSRSRTCMLTGELKNQIDAIWNAFWSGGISNPLEVIEQITYLLFIRRLYDLQANEESKAARLRMPVERVIFPEGKDARGRPYKDYRWSELKNLEAREMYEIVDAHVFPFLRT